MHLGASDLFDQRYRIVGRLGSGNFGEVWKAEDTTTGRVVALKLIDPTETTADMAWAEATRLTSLESNRIVRVHGAALAVDVPYIDMALAPRGDTSVASRPHGVTPGTAARWALQVCAGLQLAHLRGIVHRDIKPSNVLLNGAGDAMLGDFGVSAILEPDGTAAAHGDLHIGAPEMFSTFRSSPTTDVYSLGVTLYYFLTGRYPHLLADFGGDADAFTAAVAAGHPYPKIRDLAPHVGLPLARVVQQAMSADPAERFQTAEAFGAALVRVLEPPRPVRRVESHGGHEMCWEIAAGTKSSRSPLAVCVWGVSRGRCGVRVAHEATGRLVRDLSVTVTTSRVPTHLRTVFARYT